MKKLLLISGAVLIVLNLLFGLLLSSYDGFNLLFTTIVLAANTGLLYLLNSTENSDAFKVSLSLLIPIAGFIEFLLALFSPEHIKDNWCVIATILIFVISCLVVCVTWFVNRSASRK